MNKLGIALLIIIFGGTAVMAGFIAYNFMIVTYPLPKSHAAVMLTTTTPTTTTSVTTTTTTTTTTTSVSLPPGAIKLPYNPSNHTVFLYIASLSTGSPFNFNGTSNGQLHIYIPAGWTVIVYYTNEESGLAHNFLIVQNDTATPNNANVAQDGKILLYVGTSSSSYESTGLISGQSASGTITLSPGYYWFCCGIAGHALAGMWGVIIVSSSVTVPYAITS
ncbi:sulfocyanin [Sulfurisphaera javensis]|uniref:Sulfocyanin n=1 Tax=Sulfurisphaera javensis TaxID=2049879 RepID=A0AAT9GPG2_9CREN